MHDSRCVTGNNRSYLGVTRHWIDPQSLDRKSAVLACRRIKGSHTFDNLAKILEAVHKEYKIQNKTTKTITDNGSDFVKAFSEFGRISNGIAISFSTDDNAEQLTDEDFENDMNFVEIFEVLDNHPASVDEENYHLPQHQRCLAHTLNLICTKDIETALENPNYKKISRCTFAKCQSLWNKYKRSPLAADSVKDNTDKGLVTPNQTRWNSLYDSMFRVEQLLANKNNENLNSVMDELGLPRFKKDEIKFIHEYVKVMKPISIALDILQSETKCFLGFIAPTLTKLKEKLEQLKTETEFCEPLVNALLLGISKRLLQYFDIDTKTKVSEYTLSAMLLPMHKLFWIKDESKKLFLRTVLKKAIDDLEENEKRGNFVQGISQAEAEQDTGMTDDNDLDFFQYEKEEPRLKKRDEVDVYLDKTQTTNSDLQQVFQNLPTLKTLFLKYNTALPSSAPVERLFSIGGRIFEPRRNHLSDNNFEMQLLLKCNKKM